MRRVVGIVAVVMAASLSGCSSTVGGDPVPLSASPPVPHPLDLASHADDPCGLFTSDDYATFGLLDTTTKFGDEKIETVCLAQDAGETKSVDLELYLQVNLLDAEYLHLRYNGGQPLNGSFINGYPAIFDAKAIPGCVVMIATSASQSIQLHYKTTRADDQACAALTGLADRVLRRLGA